MEQKLIKFLLALNKINQKVKALSVELDNLTSNFIDEDFDKLILAENLDNIHTDDFE